MTSIMSTEQCSCGELLVLLDVTDVNVLQLIKTTKTVDQE